MSSGVSVQVRLKPACAATEASWRLEISAIESRDIILSKQRTTKALIRLRGCAGWSAPLLFAYDIRHIFSWPGSISFHKTFMYTLHQACRFWQDCFASFIESKDILFLTIPQKPILWSSRLYCIETKLSLFYNNKKQLQHRLYLEVQQLCNRTKAKLVAIPHCLILRLIYTFGFSFKIHTYYKTVL